MTHTTEPTEGAPAFQVKLEDIDKCGQTCRQLSLSLKNAGDTPAENVVVDTTLSTGGTIIWSGTERVGRLAAGDTYRTDARVDLSYEDGLRVRRNDNIVTVQMIIRTSSGDVVLQETRDVTTLERVDPALPDPTEGSVRQVEMDGTTYYLISELPGQPPNREAVTTSEYNLVSVELAEQVIGHDVFEGLTWNLDWTDQIETNRRLRNHSSENRAVGRALQLGWNITEILIFLSAGVVPAAIGPVIDAATDTVRWTQQDVEEPYREAFQRFNGCLRNSESVWQLADDVTSYRALDDTLSTYLGGVMAVSGAVDEGTVLARAWANIVRNGLSGATTSASYAVQNSGGFFIGFGVSASVGELENVLRLKSNIHGIDYAYATTRRPVLERLRVLDDRLENGTHRVGDGIEYWMHLQTNYQMTALAYAADSKYWERISDTYTGAVWDVLADAQNKADETASRAESNAATYRGIGEILGLTMRKIRDRTSQSINASVGGDDSAVAQVGAVPTGATSHPNIGSRGRHS